MQSNGHILALHFAPGQNTYSRRAMAIHLIREARGNFTKVAASVQRGARQVPDDWHGIGNKHVMLVAHYRLGFDLGSDDGWMPVVHSWPIVFLDAVTTTAPGGFNSHALMTGSMLDAINSVQCPGGTDPMLALCRKVLMQSVCQLNWGDAGPRDDRIRTLSGVLANGTAAAAVAQVLRWCLDHDDYAAGAWQLGVACDAKQLQRAGSYRSALAAAVLDRVRLALAAVLGVVELSAAAPSLADDDGGVASVAEQWAALLTSGVPLVALDLTPPRMRRRATAEETWRHVVHSQGSSIIATLLPHHGRLRFPFALALFQRLETMRAQTMEAHRSHQAVRDALTRVCDTDDFFSTFRDVGAFSAPLAQIVCLDVCQQLAVTAERRLGAATDRATVSGVTQRLAEACSQRGLLTAADVVAASWWYADVIDSLSQLQASIPRVHLWGEDTGDVEGDNDSDGDEAGKDDANGPVVKLVKAATKHTVSTLGDPATVVQAYTTPQAWSTDVFKAWGGLRRCHEAACSQLAVLDDGVARSDPIWIAAADLLHQFGTIVAVPSAMPVQRVARVASLVRDTVASLGKRAFASADFFKAVGRAVAQATSGPLLSMHAWRGVVFMNVLVSRWMHLTPVDGDDAMLVAAAKAVASQDSLHDVRTLPGTCRALRGWMGHTCAVCVLTLACASPGSPLPCRQGHDCSHHCGTGWRSRCRARRGVTGAVGSA